MKEKNSKSKKHLARHNFNFTSYKDGIHPSSNLAKVWLTKNFKADYERLLAVIKFHSDNYLWDQPRQVTNAVFKFNRIEFSTAASCFRINKKLFSHFSYNIFNSNLSVREHKNFDYTHITEDHSNSIVNRKNNGQIGSQLKYVVNVYNTTSLINVNGCRLELFVMPRTLFPNISTYVIILHTSTKTFFSYISTTSKY